METLSKRTAVLNLRTPATAQRSTAQTITKLPPAASDATSVSVCAFASNKKYYYYLFFPTRRYIKFTFSRRVCSEVSGGHRYLYSFMTSGSLSSSSGLVGNVANWCNKSDQQRSVKKRTEILVQISAPLSTALHIWPQKCYLGPFSKPPRFHFRLWSSYLRFFILGPKNAILSHFRNHQDSVSDRGNSINSSSYLAPKMLFWPIVKTSKIPLQTMVIPSMVLHIWLRKCYFGPFSKTTTFSFRPWSCHLQFFKLGPENAFLAHFKNYQYCIADRGRAICGYSYLVQKMLFWPF